MQGTTVYVGGRVIEVACLAHARRKFYDCLPSDKHAAEEVLLLISSLYDVERDIKSADFETRRATRVKRSAPVLRKIKVWLNHQKLIALPKSPLGKAISYALNNWRALCRYISNGELSIDNNASERAYHNWYSEHQTE